MNCPHCQQPLAPGAVFCSACGTPLPAGAVAPEAGEKKTKGTMWLLIGVGCFGAFVVGGGIIAAIAIPNFIMAVQRGKQRRTMGDMKTIASALEAYQSDNGHYPPGVGMEAACAALVPDYLDSCIERDGWATTEQPREIAYAAWGGMPEGCSTPESVPENPMAACGPTHYGLASAGKDGKFAVIGFHEYGEAETTSFEADIVLVDGQFIQQPAGAQRNIPSGDPYDDPPGPAPESLEEMAPDAPSPPDAPELPGGAV